MIQFLSNVGALNLCYLIAYCSGVSFSILSILRIHDFDVDFNGLVKEATWLNDHVVLQKVSELLDASLDIDIPLSIGFIFQNELFYALAFGGSGVVWKVELEEVFGLSSGIS